jgi:hypothetical protein
LFAWITVIRCRSQRFLGANCWPTYLKKAPENIRLSEGLQGSKEDLLRVAQEFGLEGLVAKRLGLLYESGRRSGAWVKVKLTRAQEFVIGGYTMPEGSRKYFGSLLVGYNSPGGLRICRQSRDRLFRKTPGQRRRATSEAQAVHLPIYQLAREDQRTLGTGHYASGHETVPVGQTRSGCPGQVYGVDARRSAASAGIPWAADRQTG